MRKLFIAASLTSLALGTAAFSYDWKTDFTKRWDSSIQFTMTVAEAMPADGYSYIPPSTVQPQERPYAGEMMHIGQFNAGMFGLVTGMKPPAMPPKGTTDKAAVIQYLNETNAFCAKALNGVTEQQLDKTVKFANIEESGRDALEGAFAHMAHTRGQGEVYLRLRNVKPPTYPFE